LLPVALLLACLDAGIDGSSPAAAQRSINEIKRELPAEQRTRLERALMFIVARELGAAMVGPYGTASTANVDRKVAEILDGKTAEEVIAYVDALRPER
jgi:hypothetical protein